jgi:hypothetical protein
MTTLQDNPFGHFAQNDTHFIDINFVAFQKRFYIIQYFYYIQRASPMKTFSVVSLNHTGHYLCIYIETYNTYIYPTIQ